MKMNNDQYFDINTQEKQTDIKELIGKYLHFWPWFLASISLTVLGASLYMLYTEPVFNSSAKVKIIDNKETPEFSLDVNKLFSKSTINLENEIALFKSYRLLKQVVEKLNLNISYYQTKSFKTSRIYAPPFRLKSHVVNINTQYPLEFSVEILKNQYKITNKLSGKQLITESVWYDGTDEAFPFSIMPMNVNGIGASEDTSYNIQINNIENTTQELIESIEIGAEGKDSDILKLSINSANGQYGKAILNTLIDVYAQDGIIDKQEISKRTIAFADERFEYLMVELDSIERTKKEYKQHNNLSFIEADATVTIQERSYKEEALFNIETQLLLSNELKQSISNETDFKLLPANIGLSSETINQLVSEYNLLVLQYEKLKMSAGINNPTLKILKENIRDLKSNIDNSLQAYSIQLETTLKQNTKAQRSVNGLFETLPQKEKILRNIERQQNLKESLYLLLLQKREEASINLAVTVSNLKVIDYGITNYTPVSPKKAIIYLGAFVFGMLLPFCVLYLKFQLNTKILTSKDIEEIDPKIPVLVEVPIIPESEENVSISKSSQLAEAFRKLVHGVKLIMPKTTDNLGQIIFVSSAIKGEGKTMVSFNLANSFAQLNKKTILIGVDFRNPQLHRYINKTKNEKGLSNYLNDPSLDWSDFLFKVSTKPNNFDVLLGGEVPPNPTLLLASDRFKLLLSELKTSYDYIICDTAPTLLVSDTLTISEFADSMIYIIRSGFTDKNLVAYSSKLFQDQKTKNVGYVINDVSYNTSYGYGYNYGYGYGYGPTAKNKKWFSFKIKS